MFVANYDSLWGHYISEVDADGMGSKVLTVNGKYIDDKNPLVEQVARLVLISLNMERGIEHATALLRAEVVRQKSND